MATPSALLAGIPGRTGAVMVTFGGSGLLGHVDAIDLDVGLEQPKDLVGFLSRPRVVVLGGGGSGGDAKTRRDGCC